MPFQQLCNEYTAAGMSPWESERFIKFVETRGWTRDDILNEITKDMNR